MKSTILYKHKRKTFLQGFFVVVAIAILGSSVAPALITRAVDEEPTLTLVAGDGTYGYADGTGTEAKFRSPRDTAIGANGTLYVADICSIRKITPDGTVSTIAGGEECGYVDGVGTDARLNGIQGLAIDTSGVLYVTDTYNYRVRKITPDGTVSTVAGDGNYGYADGIGTAAQFSIMQGITVDSADNVFIADSDNNVIRKITPDGTVSTVAGNGFPGYADGVGTNAQFSSPFGLAADSAGNIFVIDAGNYRVRKITPDGTVSTVAGNGFPGYADGVGTNAQFSNLLGITTDTTGNIYITDSGNYAVRKITPDRVVSTVWQSESWDYGSCAPAFRGAVNTAVSSVAYLSGISIDPAGDFYITDTGNCQVYKLAYPKTTVTPPTGTDGGEVIPKVPNTGKTL